MAGTSSPSGGSDNVGAGSGAAGADGLAGRDGVGDGQSQPGAAFVGVEIEPAQVTLVLDAQLSLGVWAMYSNGTREDARSHVEIVSSNPQVVRASSYRVTALAPGVATISANVYGVSATAQIRVEPKRVTAITVTTPQPSLALGEAGQAHALGLMDDGTEQDVTALATWSSANPKVARLTTSGFLIPMGQGSTTLTASVGLVSGSIEQRVTGEELTEFSIRGAHVMRLGDRGVLDLKAHHPSGRITIVSDAIWQISDPAVLSLTGDGLIQGVAPGNCAVSGWLGNDLVATAQIVVKDAVVESLRLEAEPSFEFCNPPSLRAIGTFSDGSVYDVSALLDGGAFELGLEVDGFGTEDMRLAPSALGTFELEALVDEVRAVSTFTVELGSPSTMTVTEVSPIPVAASTPLTASAGCTTDGPWVDVTNLVSWTSSDANVAAVGPFAGGVEVVGARAGTTEVRATYPGFQIEPISLSVFAGAPLALELQPDAPNFTVGDSFPMRALGRYANLGLYDLTRTCVWSSSMPLAASISNAPESAGVMTMHRAGSGVISARFGALSATTPFTVF